MTPAENRKSAFGKSKQEAKPYYRQQKFAQKVYSLQHISCKLLKEVNKRIKLINIKLKKMKKREVCIRQFTYMTKEMKKLKGMHSFTQHIKKQLPTVLVLCTHFRKQFLRRNRKCH